MNEYYNYNTSRIHGIKMVKITNFSNYERIWTLSSIHAKWLTLNAYLSVKYVIFILLSLISFACSTIFNLVTEVKSIVDKKFLWVKKDIFEGSLQSYENELQWQSCN